jgi:hypothetical protein
MRGLRVLPLLAALLLLGDFAFPAASFAQTTADIVGRVTDASGAVLPGATVTIENVGTANLQTTITNDTGDYVFTLLSIGTYTVKIEMQGFQTQTARVVLTSGDRTRIDGRLTVGGLEESVLVTGTSPLLQTDTATLSTLVSEQAVQELPVNGRNFMRLVQLVPGATEGAANAINSGSRPDDRRQTSSVSINGESENRNNQMIDGMDNNERSIGTVGVKPSMDAIAEVRVQTNLYSAEAGRASGGIINILTKSGSNQFHGTGYEFLRNDAFDSRDFFARVDPILKQHQFGGSFGGPLVSSKTFFFADYEGLRNTKGQVNNLTLPTLKMRQGDFSEILPTQIFDPATAGRVAFPGNIIPADRLNPVALKYMALLPIPTAAGLANNAQTTTIGWQHSHTADGRVDHRFNGDNSMFVRYSYNHLNLLAPAGCDAPTPGGITAVCRGPETGGFPGPNETTAHAIQTNYVRVFSPTLIGEFKVGYVKLDLASLPNNHGTNASESFGLKNTNVDEFASGLGTLNINGFTPLGDSNAVPLVIHNRTQQYHASVTKTAGAHSVKVGGGVILREFGVIQSIDLQGTWTFDTTLTRSSANVGGNSAASFILGYPTTAARIRTPFKPRMHTNEPGVFVQDDWRATSWLTLNLGVRYDVFTPFSEEENNLANIDLSGPVPVVLVAGENGVSRYAGVKVDYTDIAPRLGFAATLPHAVVLRGGYGLSYFPANTGASYYLKNTPVIDTYGPVTSAGASGGAPTIFFDGLPPPATARPSTDPAQLAGAFRAVALDFKATRMQQFNVQAEKELWGNNVVTIGYVGSRGSRTTGLPNVALAPVGPGNIQTRRNTYSVLPNINSITVGSSIYSNQYDAMQLVFQRRLSHGLSVTTHFRLAHASLNTFAPWDPKIIEHLDAPQDARRAWVFQANYELPWAREAKGLVGGFLGGWQLNAVANWQTGVPFGVTNSTALANTGGTDRPNLVGNPELPKSERTPQRWFNTAAFQAQPANTVGNAPPTVLHGPSQRRLDLALFKELKLHTSTTLQLRYEVYNVTNTPSFQNPVSTLGSSNFGSLTTTGLAIPRQMQFAAKLLF